MKHNRSKEEIKLTEIIENLKRFVSDIDEIYFDKENLLAKLAFFNPDSIRFNDTRNLIYKYLEPINQTYNDLAKFILYDGTIDVENQLKLLDELLRSINHALLDFRTGDSKSKNEDLEGYYKERITELESEINRANQIKSDNKKKTEIVNEQKEKLVDFQSKLESYQNELAEKQTWKEKISITFNKLETYLKPLEEEKNKLNIIFYVFLSLSIVLVLFLFVVEGAAFDRLTSQSGLPSFKDYIILFIPVPVAGALLWGFIYQMNRAQRQTVVLAKNIHHIKYVEGLLLAVNTLSPSVEDGITRVNSALDKMIDNHLNLKDENCELDLLAEEKKDSMPIDSALKIIDKLTHLKK